MKDLKEGSLPDSLAAALKDHLPSTYCILLLLGGNRDLTTWMICSQKAFPGESRVGSVHEADRVAAVRDVLNTGNPISYQLGPDTVDGDLRRMLTTETLSVLIVPFRNNASNIGVMIFGNEYQENGVIFTKEQTENAVMISGQVSAIFSLYRCLAQRDGIPMPFQQSPGKTLGTTAPATLGELTRSVEHEINNPLSVIVNWSEVYREDASIDPELRKKFQIIYDMSMRIAEVIRKFSEMKDARSTNS